MRHRTLAAGVAALLLGMGTSSAAAQTGPVITEGSAQDIEQANDQRLSRSAGGGAGDARAQRRNPDPGDDGGGHDHGDHQHGVDDGHLPASRENVRLVGRLDLTDKSDEIADVSGDPRRGFAYLAGRGIGEDCRTGGKIHVADIRDARRPRKAAEIQFPDFRYPGEGVHAVRINTRHFNGVLLGTNNEVCGTAGEDMDAGLSLYDVTRPTRPQALAENFGDQEFRGEPDEVIHDYHSIFVWQQGRRAFAMGTDNEEQAGYDVDIFEITDPRNPVLISETGLPDWFEGTDVIEDVTEAHGFQPLVHDFEVHNIRGTWIGLLAYWDAGYVMVNLDDPANPVFINNTDWTNPDPEFPQFTKPEGNAHQISIDRRERYIIGTDEDFSPYRTSFRITSGANQGDFEAGEFGWTVPIENLPDGELNGPTTYGGYACPASPEAIPAPPTDLAPGEESILVVSRGPVADPNANHAACFFSEKVEAGERAGYDAVIVANHHNGSAGGVFADASLCGSLGHAYTPTIQGGCVGHRALHLLFNRAPDYTTPYPAGDPGDLEPNVGDRGERISMRAEFDGWGYPHLYDARTLEEIDTYAVPEAKDEQYAQGFGALSVHEVQFEPTRDLAWFSWYSAGVRVVKYGPNGMREVGHYIAEGGSDFWGIDFGRDARGVRYALGSDRDDGLWIFRYTGS